MRKPILLLLISFLALLKSCEYDFSEDYFNDIEAIQPTATISLNDFENNIVLNAPTNVNYAYNGANRHRLFEVRIYINDEQIHFSNNEADTFFIDLDNLSDGDYELKVEYYFSSGTGSLADVFNLESYVATEIYTFSVNKSVGVPPVMTLVEIVNGTLFINWDPLSHSNFNEAYLLIEGENNQLLDEILLTEDILNSGEYNDKLSLRNELAYSIKLKNYYTEAISNKVTISIPEINVEVEILNENQHLMRWSEHPLYGNFDHYTYSNYGYSDEILDATGGELIFNTPPVFGEKIYHYLYPRRGNLIVASITKIFDFGNSFDMDLAVEYVYSSQTNSFYALEKIGPDYYGSVQQIYLHQLDPTDLSVINSLHVTNLVAGSFADLTLDPNTNNLIVDTEIGSYLINTASLSIINSWMVIDFISNEYSSRVHYRNGYMILNGGALIYNADSKALIHSTSVGYYFNVSDDGKYFYNNDGIYEINNNVVSFVTSTDTGSSVHTVEFLSDQNKCIYSNKFSNPVIYDFNSGTKSIMTNITEVNDLQYDQSTGKVLFSQLHTDAFNGHKSFINVYNTSDQTFKRLQVYDSHYSHIYRFYNNTLIFSGGLYLNQYFNN